jgi:hypothetical protein
VTEDDLKLESGRRKAQGLRTDSVIAREEAAVARVANSDGRSGDVGSLHHVIRTALKQRFGLNVSATATRQLKDAAIQFLRDRTALRDQPTPNLALVPRAAVSLGKWGEMRLEQVLEGNGKKPSKAFKTSLGYRKIDRLVNRIAHEAKGGIDVKLDNKMRTQILKDAELIQRGKFNGVHWHFFQGAEPEVLKFLEQNGIDYSIY